MILGTLLQLLLEEKDFLSFIMCNFLECFGGFFIIQWAMGQVKKEIWKRNTEKNWKKRLQALRCCNLIPRISFVFFVCLSLFLSPLNFFPSHLFKIYKVKVSQLFNFNLMKFLIWGSVLAVKRFFVIFFLAIIRY